MRDFYKTYENDQTLLRLAMKIGWTLNVVIMEAELTRDVRKWYLEQARERQWSKAVLLEKLASTAHLEKPLDVGTDTCYTGGKDIKTCVKWTSTHDIFGKSHCWIGQRWLHYLATEKTEKSCDALLKLFDKFAPLKQTEKAAQQSDMLPL